MKKLNIIFLPFFITFIAACSDLHSNFSKTICPIDIKIFNYHIKEHYKTIKKLAYRLYAKNPCYAQNKAEQKKRINAIFSENNFSYPYPGLSKLLSHELLAMAFSPKPKIKDRIFLLTLGLKKAIDEAYGTNGFFITGCQIDGQRLVRLYNNIAQVNWRLKTYRDEHGRLLFLTNAPDKNGNINMGFEVLITQMLTRIQDDIYLREGLEGNLAIKLSSVFLSIL